MMLSLSSQNLFNIIILSTSLAVSLQTDTRLNNNNQDPRILNSKRWPSHPSYPTFTVSNWDEYLAPISSSCLVHIINYENIDLPQFPVPAAISRYDYVLSADRKDSLEMCDFVPIPFGAKVASYIPSPSMSWLFKTDIERYIPNLDRRTRYRGWRCSITLYVLPTVATVYRKYLRCFVKSDQGPRWLHKDIPYEFRRMWRGEKSYYEGSMFNSFSHNWYHIALIPSSLEIPKPVQMFRDWNVAMSAILEKDHPTSHLLVFEVDKVLPNSKITGVKIVCKFCPPYNFRSLFDYPKGDDWGLAGLKQQLDYYDAKVGETSWYFKLAYEQFRNEKRHEFFRIPSSSISTLGLRHMQQLWLDYKVSAEDMLIRMWLPANISWWSAGDAACNNSALPCDKRIDPKDSFPSIETFVDVSTGTIKATGVNEFKFVSCGSFGKSNIDFQSYISAFDSWSWVFIVFSYIGLSLFLQAGILLLNHIWKLHITVEAKPYFMGLKVLLEQGDDIAINSKKFKWMYWVCGAWILAAIVITNAYKGDNISIINASFRPQPLQYLQQLVDREYKLYNFIDNFNPEMQRRIQRDKFFSGFDPLFHFASLLKELDYKNSDYAQEIDKVQASIRRTSEEYAREGIPLPKHLKQLLELAGSHRIALHPTAAARLLRGLGYYDVLEKCNKVAFFGWTFQAPFHNLLNDVDYLRIMQFPISTGVEVYQSIPVGWKIERWGHFSILNRFWALQESGIFEKWISIRNLFSKFSHHTHIRRAIAKWANQSSKGVVNNSGLKLDSNLQTVFAIFGVGIGACVIAGLIEIGPKVARILRTKVLALLKLFLQLAVRRCICYRKKPTRKGHKRKGYLIRGVIRSQH